MEEIIMGSPRKRRLKRAIAATLSPTAPLSDGVKAKLEDSAYLTNLLRYHQFGGGTSCKSSLFTTGTTPDPDRVDKYLLNAGLAGVTKSSDLDLIGVARWEVSAGNTVPDDHALIIIDGIHFMFTTTQGDGDNGDPIAAGDINCPADAANGCFLVQINPGGVATADGAVGAVFTAAVTAAAATHPELSKITFTPDDADADVLYVQTSSGAGHVVSEAGDSGEIDVQNIPGIQKSHEVKHYFLKLDGGDAADIVADEGVLWLQNGPASKYAHGVDDAAAALTVNIAPAGLAQYKRMVFKIVSDVGAGDLLTVKSIDAAHANPVALDAHAGAALYTASGVPNIMSNAARALLDPGAGVDIALGTCVLPSANAHAGAAAFGGIQLTFDRAADDASSVVMGGGVMIHWRVV